MAWSRSTANQLPTYAEREKYLARKSTQISLCTAGKMT